MEYKRETNYTPGIITTYWKNINDKDEDEHFVLCVELNKEYLKGEENGTNKN